MYQPSAFKTPTTNDTYRKKVYLFDTYLDQAIQAQKVIGNKHHYLSIEDTKELAQAILNNEKLHNVRITENSSTNTSTCSFYQNTISFAKSHLNNQEIALHEIAHYIDDLFTATKKSGHHAGFLAALEYLMDKYQFISKSLFKNLTRSFYHHYKIKVPYIENFYQVTDLNQDEYNQELEFYADNFNKLDSHKTPPPPSPLICKNVFEQPDRFITFIAIYDQMQNPLRFIKVVIKKLAYEMSNKIKKIKTKEYAVLMSPIFGISEDHHRRMKRTTRKSHMLYRGVALSMQMEHLKPDLILDLIKKQSPLKSLSEFQCRYYIDCFDNLFIAFDNYLYETKDIQNKIKELKEFFKQKRITYYQAKSIYEMNSIDEKCNIH